MPGTERRNSSSSEDASGPITKQILPDGSEYIPTRIVKTTAPKPAANPLQFIKVGPCDLYKAAQEQIKKVEEIKKVEKTVKEDSEDWQSNLDNWKCSRRKRQEHIIDRVVEVKKLELEEHERNRRRGKTLTEMIEERSSKGLGPRKMSLLVYPEDDANDLSDLGIGAATNSSGDDNVNIPDNGNYESHNNTVDSNDNKAKCENKNGTNGNGAASSPEPEEYTYERAIEGYKSFAEKKVKAVSRQRVSPPKRENGSRIEEKLNELEQVRMRSNSVTDVNLPKVDIHKRRSLFEVVESAETKSPSAERVARDLGSAKIVKERLSSLERKVEPVNKISPRPQNEVVVSIKDRLSNLEKQRSQETTPPRRVSNGDIGHVSLKERLTSLEKHQSVKDCTNGSSSSDEEVGPKLVLSPTISDREVSSPLVSAVNDGVKVGEMVTNNILEKGNKDEVEEGNLMVEGCNKGSSGDFIENNSAGCASEEGNNKTYGDIHECSEFSMVSQVETDLDVQLTTDISEVVQDASTTFSSLAVEEEGTNKILQSKIGATEASMNDGNNMVLEQKAIEKCSHELTKDIGGELTFKKHYVPEECATVTDINTTDASEVELNAKCLLPTDEAPQSLVENAEPDKQFITDKSAKPVDQSVLIVEIKSDSNCNSSIEETLQILKENIEPGKQVSSGECAKVTPDSENTVAPLETEQISNCNSLVGEAVMAVEENYEPNEQVSTETVMTVQTTVVTNVKGPVMVTEKSVKHTVVETELTPQSDLSAESASSIAPLKVSVTKTRRTVVKKPQVRVRKLTPIMVPPVQLLSPVKSPSDLAIISEDTPMPPVLVEDLGAIEEDESAEPPVPSPRKTMKASKSVKGAETSESGIDMEESSLYTDENIDEVLAEDDVDESECPPLPEQAPNTDESLPRFDHENERHHDAVNRFDELIGLSSGDKYRESKTPDLDVLKIEESVKKEDSVLIEENPTDKLEPKVDDLMNFEEEPSIPLKIAPPSLIAMADTVTNSKVEPLGDVKSVQPPALYENIILTNEQIPQFGLPGEVVSFPLGPSTIEPPKEKPPPPPIDQSDDEEAPELPPKKASLRRLDSTKRIKKEIRKKRSDFLGIEGTNDDSYLEPKVDVAPPPDMMTLLQEERRLDQQLYRESLCSEADSAEGSDRVHAVDRLDKALYLDQGLYRQSICSETDSNHETAESRDSGVELDRGHADDLCWANKSVSPDGLSHTHSRQNSEPYGNTSMTSEEDEIMKKEREIIEELEKEEEWRYGKPLSNAQQQDIGEKLAVKLRELEKEKMQLEWERAEEEGKRMADEERLQAKQVQLRQQENSSNLNKTATVSQENLRSERERLEKEQLELALAQQKLIALKRRSAEPPRQGPMSTNLRYSMPDLQGEVRSPVQAARPPTTWTRVSSAENLLTPQQMSRPTLQALAAAPRSRIVAGEAWMQPKRKQDAPKNNCNYQHWLIQEAEHRRITEQQQRTNQSRRSLPNQMRSPLQHNSNQPTPLRPHSGHFSPHFPPTVTAPYAAPPVNHTRATSNPNQPPPPPHVVNHTHSHSLSHPVSPPSHHTVGLPPSPYPHPNHQSKPLPDSVIQTLTQRVQNKASPRRRLDERPPPGKQAAVDSNHLNGEQERMLSVSGKKKCSHCGEELGRGAAMVIESLRLFYHIDCFKCCVCHTQLGDGLMGTDVRVRNNKLHCHNCYSSDDGVKFSCV